MTKYIKKELSYQKLKKKERPTPLVYVIKTCQQKKLRGYKNK